jgi:CRP/FNR family transcriptional regulator, cyclic AMP receptor protein
MSVRADADTLRRIPLFQNCDPVALQILAFASERMTVGIGDRLLVQGKTTDSAYLVLSGEIAVLADDEVIGIAEPGALLGETAMIGGTLSSVTVEARTLSYVSRITHVTFLKVAQEYPEFGQAVMQAMSLRLSHSVMDFDQVRDRLAQARNFGDLKLR